MTTMPEFTANPSISTSSWFSVWSRSSLAPLAAGIAPASDGIELVDEDDAGSGFLRLGKEVSDPGCADSDIHLDKLGAGHGKERHPGFTGYGSRQERFPRTRRAHEQHAGRHFPAEPGELRRSLSGSRLFPEVQPLPLRLRPHR